MYAYCSVPYACRATTVASVMPAGAREEGRSLVAALKEGTSTDAARREGEGNRATETEQESAEFYDDVYFSSGSSMEEGDVEDEGDESREGGRRKKKKKTEHRVLTNDELFYDPDMDDDDQKWVNRQRMAYHNGKQLHQACANVRTTGLSRLSLPPVHAVKVAEELVKEKRTLQEEESHGSSQRKGKDRLQDSGTAVMPTSDAILSCPACLTTLCLDCQRSLAA